MLRDIANTFCARPKTQRRGPESAMDESDLVPLKPMGKCPFTYLWLLLALFLLSSLFMHSHLVGFHLLLFSTFFMWGRSQIIRQGESLVFQKSLNTLWWTLSASRKIQINIRGNVYSTRQRLSEDVFKINLNRRCSISAEGYWKGTQFVNNFIEVSKTFIFDFQNVLKNYQRTNDPKFWSENKCRSRDPIFLSNFRISLFSFSCKVQFCFPG